MKALFAASLLITAGQALAGIASINGMSMTTRNFNDFPNSIGTYQNDSNPAVPFPAGPNGHISIGTLAGEHKVNELLQAGGNFANRHLMFFSSDGGATSHGFNLTDTFTASARVRVRTTEMLWSIGTRSIEAGFWAHVPRRNDNNGNNYTDEGGFFATTNGTTFMGGAGLPFYLAGEGGWPNPNVPPFFTGATQTDGSVEGYMDQTFMYQPPDGLGSNAFVRMIVTDGVSGVTKDSGWLEMFNSVDQFGDNGGWWNPGTQFGFRIQNAPQAEFNDTQVNVTISNISIIPAPGAAGALALAGLAGLRRRR